MMLCTQFRRRDEIFLHSENDMETREERTKNQEFLLRASKQGDVASVRALLEGGVVQIDGVNWVRLLSALRQAACGARDNVDVACAGWPNRYELSVRMDPTSRSVV
jgi:hypothetical protein